MRLASLDDAASDGEGHRDDGRAADLAFDRVFFAATTPPVMSDLRGQHDRPCRAGGLPPPSPA